MSVSNLFIWLMSNIVFFALNFFVFKLLNGKLWKKLSLNSVFSRNKFAFILGISAVMLMMFFLMGDTTARIIHYASKSQISQKQLIEFLSLSIGFSIIWSAISDRFSKLLLQILTNRNELLEVESENSFFFPIRLILFVLVAVAFAPIVLSIISTMIPELALPQLIR